MKKIISIIIAAALLVLIGIFFVAKKSASKTNNQKIEENIQEGIEVPSPISNESNEPEEILPISPISGIASENGDRRPFAVMLAGDENTRPLSGIGQADLVVEMPVIKNGINRLMAVYATENPAEIGSVRSARHDFIPLARGLGAVYAHWGGSHFALDKLNAKIMNNLDALANPFGVFYRKAGIKSPDNGFTNIERMIISAEKLGYEIKNSEQAKNIISEKDWNPEADGWTYGGGDIAVNYPGKFGVVWEYNQDEKLYYRFRGGTPEIDKNTGKQVSAKVIALISAESRHLEGQYNDVDIEGSGDVKIYQGGFLIEGKWIKDKNNQDSQMRFVNKNGFDIQLLAGQRWWEVYDSL